MGLPVVAVIEELDRSEISLAQRPLLRIELLGLSGRAVRVATWVSHGVGPLSGRVAIGRKDRCRVSARLCRVLLHRLGRTLEGTKHESNHEFNHEL